MSSREIMWGLRCTTKPRTNCVIVTRWPEKINSNRKIKVRLEFIEVIDFAKRVDV
jgi:hypothetical protein